MSGAKYRICRFKNGFSMLSYTIQKKNLSTDEWVDLGGDYFGYPPDEYGRNSIFFFSFREAEKHLMKILQGYSISNFSYYDEEGNPTDGP